MLEPDETLLGPYLDLTVRELLELDETELRVLICLPPEKGDQSMANLHSIYACLDTLNCLALGMVALTAQSSMTAENHAHGPN